MARGVRARCAVKATFAASPSAVMPRFMRGIQYSAAAVASRNFRRGVLGRPVEPGDDKCVSYRT
ncbi:hypothetical protein FNJ47_18490 [Bradyrhizobium sp. UFLA 03-164]|uniref:Uncharacterized protein n=1 Tax=Bradyrhizobium uaiense TaxID=2594946 RepID=A0A6P1BH65_9BRAD|nr:hypothetical protein [Bradyrhizobium uaiense]